MDTLSYKTISVNKATAQKEWVVVDATGQSLGRIAAKVAKLLRGKYKPSYTPHVWATNYCVTSMYTPVANIRTKLSNPKL